MSDTTNIVIVGGGYGGIQTAIELEKSLLSNKSNINNKSKYQIILIDRKSHFYHSVGALRTTIEDDFEKKIMIPYSKLFKSENNKVIHANVIAIHKNEVVIDEKIDNRDGNVKTIPFKYLVIATGSDYTPPAKTQFYNKDEGIEKIVEIRETIKKAKKILIIGGGPIGCELAGELATAYGKQKEITLVHNGEHLLNDTFSKKLPDTLLKELKALGVNVILGEKVDLSSVEIGEGLKPLNLVTDKNRVIESDVQFLATGTKPNVGLVKSLDGSLIEEERGLVKVKPTFQLDSNDPEYENIFAVGDITNFKETKLAYRASLHAKIVVKNILTKIGPSSSDKKLAEYKPPAEMIFVTIGKNGGAGYLPILGGIVVGNMFTRSIKSKNLFVDRYRKLLNAGPNDL